MRLARSTITLLVTPLLAATTAAQAGGQLRLVEDPALGSFIDISGSGSPIDVSGDGEVPIDGTFSGSFLLRPGLVIVGQNGGLGFGSVAVTDLDPENAPIPSDAAFEGGQSLLVFWDDIDDKEGDVFEQDLGDRVIVQWNFGNFEATGDTLRFQAQIFRNPQPSGIYAQFLYRIDGSTTGAGAGATIGYQDGGAGFGDIQFSFNRPEAVADGTVLTLLIPCTGDANADGAVDLLDLMSVILDWGTGGAAHGGDVDGSGLVDVADLLAVIEAWGRCPD